MKRLLEDTLEFLLKTVGGMLVLATLIVLAFLAIFWPRERTEPPPWLGIVGRSLDAKTARQYGLPFDRAVLVEQVFSDSPADLSNLAPGDCVIKYNGRNVYTDAQLRSLVLDQDPEEKAWMTVFRGGSYYNVMLRLGAKPVDQALPGQAVALAAGGGAAGFTGPSAGQVAAANAAPPIAADANMSHQYRGVCSNCHVIVSSQMANQPMTQLVAALRARQNPQGFTMAQQGAMGWQQGPGRNLPGARNLVPLEEFAWAGIVIEVFTPAGAAARGVATNTPGVLVDEILPGSRGERGGILAGDVITEINGVQVYDVDSFASAVQSQNLTGGVLLVSRGGNQAYVTVPEK